MKHYIGTKLIKALPMTRKEYNDFRGWELPADENGDDAGYLVEYADGGQANTEKYAGYVSWSPTAVFEQAYEELPEHDETKSHVTRLAGERTQLVNKLNKLTAFQSADVFFGLSFKQQDLLRKQAVVMGDYLAILDSRLWE